MIRGGQNNSGLHQPQQVAGTTIFRPKPDEFGPLPTRNSSAQRTTLSQQLCARHVGPVHSDCQTRRCADIWCAGLRCSRKMAVRHTIIALFAAYLPVFLIWQSQTLCYQAQMTAMYTDSSACLQCLQGWGFWNSAYPRLFQNRTRGAVFIHHCCSHERWVHRGTSHRYKESLPGR